MPMRNRVSQLMSAPLLLVAVGCTHPSLLGISAEVERDQPGVSLTTATARPAFAPSSRKVIKGAEGEHISLDRPTLGDVDGDGYDDFVVATPWMSSDTEYGSSVHLFYGRSDFADQLTTLDAAASFDGGAFVALGDINCDGLSDFALGHSDGYELIFGAQTRWSGSQAAYANGVAWRLPERAWALQELLKLGDVDGDGCDEFIAVTVGDTPDPTNYLTHHVIAGRKGEWPSGVWDESWAVAKLGNEPPVFEDNGTTTVVQRLSVMAAGDLDGDGLVDLLALGRWRIWVFYGSAEGFTGTITTEQADASLLWELATGDRVDFAKTMPILINDLDGDGTAELGLPSAFELGIAYGTKTRWTGRTQLAPDLTIVRSMGQLSEGFIETTWFGLEQGFALTLPGPKQLSALVSVSTADLDGDGRRELLLQEDLNPWPASPENIVRRVMYSLTGASKHASGRYVLRESDKYQLAEEDADALANAQLLDPGGDFDGDGSDDLLFGLTSAPATAQAEASMHLLSGTPNDPD